VLHLQERPVSTARSDLNATDEPPSDFMIIFRCSLDDRRAGCVAWALSTWWLMRMSGAAWVRRGWLWHRGQAAVGVSSVTWFQVVNRVVISCRYWTAVSRWWRGRKWGDIPLNADRNR
jgi:hypothetical protein